MNSLRTSVLSGRPEHAPGANLYVNNPGLLEPDSFIRLSVLSYKHKVKVWNRGLQDALFLVAHSISEFIKLEIRDKLI